MNVKQNIVCNFDKLLIVTAYMIDPVHVSNLKMISSVNEINGNLRLL